MNKTLKWLGGGIAAAMLLGLVGLFSGEVADAQPTVPPHRFAGTVSIDGEAAAAGTSVTALVGDVECGSATVITGAAGSTYAVDVPSSCADEGDTVTFKVMGYEAAESGTWSSGARTDLDLNATTHMPEEDMSEECPDESMDDMGDDMGDDPAEPAEPAEPMDDMSDDMADDCPTDDMDDMDDPDEPSEPGDDMGTGAPAPADTGTGLASTNTSTSLVAILGVMALAITLGGYTVARRRR